jgi:hypothetical protein
LDEAGTTAGTPTFTSRWEIDLDVGLGAPTLLPFPQGGVVVVARQWLSYIGADGNVNWTRRAAVVPFAWASTGSQLLLSTIGTNNLWQISESGAQTWSVTAEGYPLIAADQPWLYSRDGLYRLDEETQTAALHYPLPPGSLTQGDAIALPDGGLLLAHSDRFDSRLIAFNADGSLRWERSYRGLIDGRVHLLTTGRDLYLLAEEGDDSHGSLSVYAIEPLQGELTYIFSGGSRTYEAAETWMMTHEEPLLLLNIGGGHLLALDAQEAVGMVGGTAAFP